MKRISFATMVKPVGSSCNMRCQYCYYLPVKVSHTVMDEETLEKMIRNCIESSSNDVVSFVWHGGEPTLAGLDFFRRIVELEKKHLPQGWQCWNNLQTNGLNINEEWCRFLKENRFDVGISIDGTRWLHDKYRRDVQGERTYERIAANIALLRKYGITPDLLCTVNSDTTRYPLEVYRTLKNLNTGWMQFIPIVNRDPDGSLRQESVDPVQYGKFLTAIFNEWIMHDLGKCNVQLFIELVNTMAGGRPSLCWLQETCGIVPVVEADGSVYSCDHFVRDEYRIGTVDQHMADLLTSDFQQRFGTNKKTGLTQKCLNCPYLSYCNGGCPKDRFLVNEEGESGQYYLCEGLRMLFAEAQPKVRRLIELNGRRLTRQQIMNTLQQEFRSK